MKKEKNNGDFNFIEFFIMLLIYSFIYLVNGNTLITLTKNQQFMHMIALFLLMGTHFAYTIMLMNVKKKNNKIKR